MEIGRTSLEEQLKSAETARDYLNQQREALVDTNTLMADLNGRAKEWKESGEISVKNIERMSLSMAAYGQIIQTNININKGVEEQERKILAIKEEQNKKAEEAVTLAKTHTDKLAGQIGEGIVNPVKGISSAFSEITKNIPMMGTAMLVLSPIISELAGRLSAIRDITRTGGLGATEGMGGIGNMMALSGEISMAAMSVPFLKASYGSKAELGQGAGLMFGMGGIRGSDLTEVMSTLPKQAHEMGISFGDASQIMAKMHRVLKESPFEMKDSLTMMGDAAKDSGMAVKDFTKAVADTAMQVAHYGLSIESVTDITKKYAHLISDENVSREELAHFILMEARAKRDDMGITDDLAKATAMAAMGGYRVADSFRIQEQVTQTLIPVVKDAGEALKMSGDMTPIFTKAIVEGRMQLETLTGILPDLISKYHFSEEAIVGFSEAVTNLSKRTGIAAPELSKDILGMSNSLSKMFSDPGQGLVLATSAVSSFARMMKDGQMTIDDFTKVVKSNMDVFGMGGAEAKSQFSTLADIVHKTNVRMEELSAYVSENAKINKQYGYDLNSSTALLVAFNDQIRAGALSIQDLQMISKGPAGSSEGFKAIIAQGLGKTGGQLGGAFSGGDMLTQIEMLRDLQESFVSGVPSERMQRHGITSVTSEMEKTYNNTFRSALLSMTGGSQEEAGTLFKKMSPQIMGAQFSGVGGAAESFWQLISTGKANFSGHEYSSMRELSDAISKLLPKENSESYFTKFGKSSDTLYTAAKLMEAVYTKALADKGDEKEAQDKYIERSLKTGQDRYQGIVRDNWDALQIKEKMWAAEGSLDVDKYKITEGRKYAQESRTTGKITDAMALKSWETHMAALTDALKKGTNISVTVPAGGKVSEGSIK